MRTMIFYAILAIGSVLIAFGSNWMMGAGVFTAGIAMLYAMQGFYEATIVTIVKVNNNLD